MLTSKSRDQSALFFSLHFKPVEKLLTINEQNMSLRFDCILFLGMVICGRFQLSYT